MITNTNTHILPPAHHLMQMGQQEESLQAHVHQAQLQVQVAQQQECKHTPQQLGKRPVLPICGALLPQQQAVVSALHL